ncbi:MAG: glycosyltransferase [Gracilimonas sp.]|uniref:glycosyltransferase n=1 Tax=Gracilimonas sp. TaxID=1974203 RepID=UPI00199EE5E7|nr:glycosyltransferase [Gracilimonas sp.]MBD3615569.1 glycosyltransferase [Gracilimonas sp.]
MDLLLYIAAGYLTFTIAVFTRNWFEFRSLSEFQPFSGSRKSAPLVSICIPARNEEKVIETCVTSALKQDYPNFEVLVLDDNSTDDTPVILEKLSGIINNLHHLNGNEKPDEWLGKPWACHQLSNHANGDYLIFIDADVWLEESAISKAVNALQKSDVITVWPKQKLKTFWEKLIIPMVYYGLYSLLPARYVEKVPKWLPKSLHKKMSSKFAAACGQFLAFNKEAYNKIGGHTSVKKEVVEDVELSKVIKNHGLMLSMYDGVGTVNCRMYQSHKEIFEGLRKNFFAGFGKNTSLFLTMTVLQFIVYVLPFYILFTGNSGQQLFAGLLVAVILVQRWMLDFKFGWNPIMSFLQPITILWYEILAARCLWDHYSGKKAYWKGREV